MNIAVVIVHGVGDPLPGDALRKLTQGLADTHRGDRLEEVGMPWVDRLKESDLQEGVTFPVTKATLTVDNKLHTIHLREVYWGDLSRVKSSLMGLVYALFDFIFGLRYIVCAATKQLVGKPGRSAGWLAEKALCIARGPLFALNILAAAVCCIYALLLSVKPWGPAGPPIAAPLAAVLWASVAVLIAGIGFELIVKDRQWSPGTWRWMTTLSALSLVLSFFMRNQLALGLGSYVYLVTTLMTVVASVMAVLGLASLVVAAVAHTRNKSRDRRIDGPVAAIVFCTALSLGLFVFAVIGAWTLIIKSLAEDLESRTARCLKGASEYFHKCMVEKSPDPAAALADRIESGIHLLPFVVFAFFVLAVLFALVVVYNWWLSRKPDSDRRPRHRYIVNRWVLFFYVLVTFLYGLAFLLLAYVLIGAGRCPPWLGAEEALACAPSKWTDVPAFWQTLARTAPKVEFLDSIVKGVHDFDMALKASAIAVTALLIAFVVSQRAQLLPALDLVLDVIAHFRTSSAGRTELWTRMMNRFEAVMKDTIADTKAERLVILSHSQGTTIAAYGLGLLNIDGPRSRDRLQNVRLITMGSPIDHLYRYYMPDRYTLCATPDPELRWANIYRIDDFIGTNIKGVSETLPTNTCIGTGGHTNYWNDPNVVLQLLAFSTT